MAPPGDGGVDAGDLCGTVACPADRPLCSDARECIQCTADDATYCTDQGLLCDEGTSSCIGCSATGIAPTPTKAQCDNNICVPCTEQGQCKGIEGISAAQSACADGVCVRLHPETETETCAGPRTCNPATNECTDVFVGSLEVCEECVSDSQAARTEIQRPHTAACHLRGWRTIVFRIVIRGFV